MHAPKALVPARRWALVVVLLVVVGTAVPVFSAIVLRSTVGTGTAPSAMAVNPLTDRVYVANYFGGTTSVLDAAGESNLATPSMGPGLTIPNAVVVNAVASPPRAYVANFWTGTVGVIDESSLTLTSTISAAASHGSVAPRALALDVSGATPKLYVAEYGRNAVAVYNASTYAFIKRITVGQSPRALGIFSSLGHKRIYVANRFSNTVSIIDGETDALVSNVAVGAAPKAIAIDTSTGWAWVTNELGNSVTAINASDTVAGTVAVGQKPEGIAIDPANGRVFVANYNSGTVSVVRTSDRTREATLTVGTGPWAIAVDSTDGIAYVACFGADSVSVIDAALTARSVSVGDGPYALAVDENTAPHKVFVANRNSNNVSVLGDDGLGWLRPATPMAFAAGLPIASATVDSVSTDPVTGDAVLEGSVTSARPFPAAILDVSVRLDGFGAWQKAAIISGAGTSAVRWRLVTAPLAAGTHTVGVRVFDQTAAASSSSEGAGADKGFSAGSPISVVIDTGPVLSPKRGMACAACHGTPARGNSKRIPTPLDRCPQNR